MQQKIKIKKELIFFFFNVRGELHGVFVRNGESACICAVYNPRGVYIMLRTLSSTVADAAVLATIQLIRIYIGTHIFHLPVSRELRIHELSVYRGCFFKFCILIK